MGTKTKTTIKSRKTSSFLLLVKEQVATPAPHPQFQTMQFLTIEDKRDTVAAVSYFLSTLKTQNVRDNERIQTYESLLSRLQLDLSKYTL